MEYSLQIAVDSNYDNASNMSGVYTGLQARIKELNSLAEYVPCSAHSLNLVGVTAAECCVLAVDFLGFLRQLYTFFSSSTHRWAILKSKLQKDIKLPKNLSQTRWSARAEACEALNAGYNNYIVALQDLYEDETQQPKTRVEADGLLKKFGLLETGIMPIAWNTIMERFNKVNKKLQEDG